MKTAEFIYVGDAQVKQVLATLVNQSAWFQLDPRPFEEWAITVKSEHAPRMPLVFYVEHDGVTWRSVFPPHLEQFASKHSTWSEAAQWIKNNAGADAEIKILNQFNKAFRFTLQGKVYDIHANDYDQAVVFAACENHQFREQSYSCIEIRQDSDLVQLELQQPIPFGFRIHFDNSTLSGFRICEGKSGGFVAEEMRNGVCWQASEVLLFPEVLAWISKMLSGFQTWSVWHDV
ncbi:hypothetical protein ACK3BE_33140 (plasmid) [Pseudomonas mandelii]|uniref:hypothetical protein n=1 Tax=Pseudomonas mandelii TaxID=75612 RepID=UPI00398D0B4B